MNMFSQGDLIRIHGFQNLFLIVSKNTYIAATNTFHVCPVLKNIPEGPLHIMITGKNGEEGTVICEQIKFIDPGVRRCSKKDYLTYSSIINISDAIQGIFEYD